MQGADHSRRIGELPGIEFESNILGRIVIFTAEPARVDPQQVATISVPEPVHCVQDASLVIVAAKENTENPFRRQERITIRSSPRCSSLRCDRVHTGGSTAVIPQ